MRPIKFRAWDKERKSMQTSKRNLVTFDGHVMPQGRSDWADGRYELMQFTGLLDKNGKEIYEGDVVTWGLMDYDSVNDTIVTSDGCGVIEYDTDLGMFGFKKPNRYGILQMEPKMEVIGNIYENPELVKVK